MSAIEAIDDSVENVTGSRCDDVLREEIESILSDAWKDYSTWLDVTTDSSMMKDAESHLRAAARICNAITDSVGKDVTNELGVPVAEEVSRALLSLTEAL